MGWIAFTAGISIIFGVVFLIGLAYRSAGETVEEKNGGLVAALGSIIGWWVLFGIGTGIASIHTVPAGHVGIVYTFGSITNQTGDGLVLTAPWQTIKRASVQVQTLCFADGEGTCPDGATKVGEGLDSFSVETQDVFIDAVLRIQVDPVEVQGLYRRVGPNYVNKLIPGQIAQVFKDETVNYSAVDIAPAREQIRSNVERELRKELAPFSIGVDALLIENIAFEPEFQQAIRDKQVATQRALEQQELIAAEKARADQAIEQARGRAESVKVEASAQAEANRLLAESLTDQLIRFQALQKLADNVTIALIPSGEGVIIDPTTLLQGAP